MKLIILLITIGGLFAFTLYKSYHYDNIFRMFIYMIVGISWVLLFARTILEDNIKFGKNHRYSSFSSSFVGVLILLVNIGIYSYFEKKVNAPSLIKAQIFGGYADFKKDGKYIIVSGSWASRTHFYGTYEINDSIITVDRKYFDDVLTTNRFVVRASDSLMQGTYDGNKISIDTYLIQIDKNGNEIVRKYNQQNHRLRVVINNIN